MPTMPNRSTDLSPSGQRSRKARGTEVTKGASKPAEIPEPNPDWGTVARGLWDSAHSSGQADWYQTSDWWTLYLLLDQVDYLYRKTKDGEPRNRSPELIKAILSGLGELMFTEGSRRKLHVELVSGEDRNHEILASVQALFDQPAT